MRTIIICIALMIGLTMTGRSDDTLLVRSFRTIDMCSSEKSCLFVLDLGRITGSDSLMLFDITLSYDTAAFRPGVLLKENTLGNQLNFYNGPFMNLSVSGEIRLTGFTVNRPAIGQLPLIAFNGDLLKDICEPETILSLAYPPEFNEEFKRSVTTTVFQPVVPVRTQKIDTTLGVRFTIDSVHTDSNTSIEIPFRITQENNAGTSVAFYVKDNESGIRMRYVTVNGVQSDVVRMNEDTIIVQFDRTRPLIEAVLHIERTRDTVNTKLHAEMFVDSCSCKVPGVADSVSIQYETQPTTSVDADEDVVKVTYEGEYLQTQHLHEHPIALAVYNTVGCLMWSTTTPSTNESLHSLSMQAGIYFVVVTTSTRSFARKIVKK